jgi:hypothetical protein
MIRMRVTDQRMVHIIDPRMVETARNMIETDQTTMSYYTSQRIVKTFQIMVDTGRKYE